MKVHHEKPVNSCTVGYLQPYRALDSSTLTDDSIASARTQKLNSSSCSRDKPYEAVKHTTKWGFIVGYGGYFILGWALVNGKSLHELHVEKNWQVHRHKTLLGYKEALSHP